LKSQKTKIKPPQKEEFESLKEEILKRASWKKGVTVTGLTMFLAEHPDRNNLTPMIRELEKEHKIIVSPIQIKNEAALFGASFQTLIKVV
jgi:hypothetical protein